MRKWLITIAATLVALVLWTALWFGGVLEGWWHTPLAAKGDWKAFADAAIARIDAEHKGNASFALLKGGKLFATHNVSIARPVDSGTLYQVASLSKWVTSFGVMHLVEEGKIDLDKPVDTYLTRWHLPKGAYDNKGVTVRRLLSHTAGLTDGLGYKGFEPGQKVQTVVESLTRTADPSGGNSGDGRVRVGYEPGKGWQYSGGGFTILQLLIEEVSGKPFNDYMRETVLEPFGMTHSTYVLSDADKARVATFYDTDGKPAIHYQFAAKAAASLYTSTDDLAQLLQAVSGTAGKKVGAGVVSPATLKRMRDPHGYQYGVAIWGLGTILYAPAHGSDWIIGHDGGNFPAINTTARVDPETGDGIVVLESGNDRLASEIGSEWTYWETGTPDLIMVLSDTNRLFWVLITGGVLILLGGLLTGFLWRQRRA